MENNRSKIRPKSNLVKLGNLIPTVKQNLGLENNLKITALCEIWPLITSFEIAKSSKPAYFDKENNLVISTRSPSLTSELSMQKLTIIKKLKEATRNTDIKFNDIRFVNRK